MVAKFGTKPEERRALVEKFATSKAVSSARIIERRDYRRRWSRKRQLEFLSQGLTTMGTPRKYRSWPELKGLDRKEYHREHMRMWRKIGL